MPYLACTTCKPSPSTCKGGEWYDYIGVPPLRPHSHLVCYCFYGIECSRWIQYNACDKGYTYNSGTGYCELPPTPAGAFSRPIIFALTFLNRKRKKRKRTSQVLNPT